MTVHDPQKHLPTVGSVGEASAGLGAFSASSLRRRDTSATAASLSVRSPASAGLVVSVVKSIEAAAPIMIITITNLFGQ